MDYRVVIGLEIHVQLRTKSKMFCSCPNRMLAEPNTLICPVCMGYPGVLPTPNQEAIRKTVLAGLMINCDIPEYSKFDRKSYFYPRYAQELPAHAVRSPRSASVAASLRRGAALQWRRSRRSWCRLIASI